MWTPAAAGHSPRRRPHHLQLSLGQKIQEVMGRCTITFAPSDTPRCGVDRHGRLAHPSREGSTCRPAQGSWPQVQLNTPNARLGCLGTGYLTASTGVPLPQGQRLACRSNFTLEHRGLWQTLHSLLSSAADLVARLPHGSCRGILRSGLRPGVPGVRKGQRTHLHPNQAGPTPHTLSPSQARQERNGMAVA